MASKKLIEEVWEKAKEIRGKDPDVWRKDKYENKIRLRIFLEKSSDFVQGSEQFGKFRAQSPVLFSVKNRQN